MSVPEVPASGLHVESGLKIDELPRGVKAYGTRDVVDGVRMSGLIPGIRIAGHIFSASGEDLGVDYEVLDGEYLSLEDVPRVLGEPAAKNKLGH